MIKIVIFFLVYIIAALFIHNRIYAGHPLENKFGLVTILAAGICICIFLGILSGSGIFYLFSILYLRHDLDMFLLLPTTMGLVGLILGGWVGSVEPDDNKIYLDIDEDNWEM